MSRRNHIPLKHRNLPLMLLKAREQIFSHFRPLLNTVGLTEQQWRILRALLDHGPLEPRQISEICCLSSPSLAGILARMDDFGLVERERFENDQRRVQVSVTPKAKALALELAPQIEDTYAELEAQIGVDLMQTLYITLDKLNSKLEDIKH